MLAVTIHVPHSRMVGRPLARYVAGFHRPLLPSPTAIKRPMRRRKSYALSVTATVPRTGEREGPEYAVTAKPLYDALLGGITWCVGTVSSNKKLSELKQQKGLGARTSWLCSSASSSAAGHRRNGGRRSRPS